MWGLGENTRLAVDSFLGLTVTLVVDGYPATFTVLGVGVGPDHVVTSLMLPLSGSEAGSNIVFYAGTAGAFVDPAADLAFAMGVEPGALVLDRHLTPSADGSGMTGLTEISHINQAIGILVSRGHTVETARAELHRRARHDGIPAPVHAQRLIDRCGRGSSTRW